jgi:hypothetical protein
VIEEAVRSGGLVETALRLSEATTFLRYERAFKDELIAAPDARHSTAYRISKAEMGLMLAGARAGPLKLAVGATASAHWIPADLEEIYGSARWSYTVFSRWDL